MRFSIFGTCEAVDAHFQTPAGEQDAYRMAWGIFESKDLVDFELGEVGYPEAVEKWLDFWIARRNAREDAVAAEPLPEVI